MTALRTLHCLDRTSLKILSHIVCGWRLRGTKKERAGLYPSIINTSGEMKQPPEENEIDSICQDSVSTQRLIFRLTAMGADN
ncbi:hypothetical protein TNCT_339091 [Trichonephila clavata]|uniref:Uncharacterized protein n=1 Tax=Trichonephila clavata TaxID=2740835 RepID=A0A8X6KQ62_TRICU|nr:hypothetical protein TNCT_339091 [Trichonephila clavata]